MLRENQVGTTALLALLQGLSHASSGPDITTRQSTEKNLLERVHCMMKDTMTRPSALQPVVQASFTMAGLVVGRVAGHSIRHAMVRGVYDCLQDSATDQLRTLVVQSRSDNNQMTMHDIKTLVKTLRDTREDLIPEGQPGDHNSDILLTSLLGMMESRAEDGDGNGHHPDTKITAAAAMLTKHITHLLVQSAKTI